MIIFDLQCPSEHVFEAWFGSSADYENQRKRKLVECPYCGSTKVSKAPMAAAVPKKGNAKSAANVSAEAAKSDTANLPVASTPPSAPAEIKEFLKTVAEAQAKAIKDSKWVGRDFDKQARAMDAGEEPHTAIHGEVSPDEAKALHEDGIKVMPLLFPIVPPEKQN